jgi:hypothetical protein
VSALGTIAGEAVTPSQPVGISSYLDRSSTMATLGAQYMVELKFLDYKDGEPIDHDKIVATLETLINDAIEALSTNTDQSIALGVVTYETDYPVDEDE